jgi:hypothetical protein
MKKIVTVLFLFSFMIISAFGQNELNDFYELDKEIVYDSIYYDSYIFENYLRKVKVNAYANNELKFTLKLESKGSDSTYVLGEAIVINYKQDIRKTYVWDPYYGLYYIGQIIIENENREWIKSYTNYVDGSVKVVTDYTTDPNTKKRFIRSEYRRDLSIVKTFPEYFKKLYREKYGEIKPN